MVTVPPDNRGEPDHHQGDEPIGDRLAIGHDGCALEPQVTSRAFVRTWRSHVDAAAAPSARWMRPIRPAIIEAQAR